MSVRNAAEGPQSNKCYDEGLYGASALRPDRSRTFLLMSLPTYVIIRLR